MWIALIASLAQAGELTGLVLDADTGAPIVGVPVLAYDERLRWAKATTTTAGRFTLTGLPSGRYRLYAVPNEASPFVSRFWPDEWSFCEAEPLEVNEDSSIDGLDFVLSRGASVAGRIVDGAGEPVSGAPMICYGLDTRVMNVRRELSSDADGRFLFQGLDAEGASSYMLEVAPANMPIQAWGGAYDADEGVPLLVEPLQDQDLGDWTLLPGVTLRGQIRGEGAPLLGATVYAYASSQVSSTTTDAEGYFEAVVPPGDALIWADLTGWAQTYWPGQDRPSTERIDASTDGAVLDDLDLDLPLQAQVMARLSPLNADQDLSEVSVLLYNDTHTVGRGVSMDEQGLATVGGLYGGDYHLAVYAADQGWVDDFVRDAEGAERVFTVADGGVLEVEIELPQGAALTGRIEDDRGAPVYGARVQLDPSDPAGRSFITSTDHGGDWELPGLFAERYTLTVSYTAWCPKDRGWVTVYWPGEVNPALAQRLTLAEGEQPEPITLVLPYDEDQDAMGDLWEQAHGLDTQGDDSAEDPDQDGFTNLEEYLLGTDPQDEVATEQPCGCRRGEQALLLLSLGLLRRRRV